MSKDNEIQTFFGRCRCCLDYSYLKHMWQQHCWNGDIEVYGDMLAECFALSMERSVEKKEWDLICEACVQKLRDANNFKKKVLESQAELLEQFNEGTEVEVKIETHYDNEEMEVELALLDEIQEEGDGGLKEEEIEEVYEQIEYLEEDDVAQEIVTTVPEVTAAPQPVPVEDQQPAKRKWPKRLPKNERYKTYKQYTAEDLKKCLEAVESEKMNMLEASKIYNIPRKTIAFKLKEAKDYEPDPDKEKTYNFIQEIKSILTYTNATAYKSKANRFYCPYCGPDTLYEDFDDLRTHIRTQHVDDRIKKIEYSMRPHWLNEVLKMDIKDLICTVCCTVMISWNEMFKHLKGHGVVLDQAYSRVIPYDLRPDNVNCALCKQLFSNYMLLDAHMNAHYNNYMCDDCGDTFITSGRLKQHVKTHDIGKHPCNYCHKVFNLEKYRKKHETIVHKHLSIHKCLYCDEKFASEFVRHNHVVEKHNEKIKIITCELCGKTFTLRHYYHCHMRKKHRRTSVTYPCNLCGEQFALKKHLRDHKLKHTGEERFYCDQCDKHYACRASLTMHLRKHAAEANEE